MAATGNLRQHFLHDALKKRDATLIPKLPPRASFAATSIVEDALAKNRGVSADEFHGALTNDSKKETPFADTVIGRFWNDPDNRGIVDAFMNNKLCRDAAKGDETALKAYKNYAIQDYFYLIGWVRFRALRFATLPRHDLHDLKRLDLVNELASVAKTMGYVDDWYDTCTKNLGITTKEFHVEQTVEEIAYENYLQNNAESDDWYNLHVILIGCYWAWCKLALELYNDSNTKKDTVFYKYWIADNLDLTDPTNPQLPESATTLSDFLDANASVWASAESGQQAKGLFRTALRLEVGLFNSAYETPTPAPVNP